MGKTFDNYADRGRGDSDSFGETIKAGVSGRMKFLVLAGIAAIAILFSLPELVEEIYPDDLTVIQQPVTGKLTWYTSPGWASQGFGTVTTYKKRVTYDFPEIKDAKGNSAGGISIRFLDGGHATMYGSVQFNLPTDDLNLTKLHSNYRGNDTVVKNLIETVVNKSIYLSGTLMTSKESYAEQRNDLIHYVTDQIQNGVYKTKQTTTWIKDDLTGQSKEVTRAEILMGKDGLPERQEDSVLNAYGIKAYNFTIATMPYDDIIEKQIRNQQEITMSVQTSIAEAKREEQRALTAEATGKANTAKAKWEQETIKAQKVTEAEQNKQVAITDATREKEVAETNARRELAVADLARQAAEQNKQKNILDGEGEAQKRQLILAADGALSQKLATYEHVANIWANALSAYHGDITPRFVVGGGSTGGASGDALTQFMTLQNAKVMSDLNLSLDMRSQTPQPATLKAK